jgi:hypothetical protein
VVAEVRLLGGAEEPSGTEDATLSFSSKNPIAPHQCMLLPRSTNTHMMPVEPLVYRPDSLAATMRNPYGTSISLFAVACCCQPLGAYTYPCQ